MSFLRRSDPNRQVTSQGTAVVHDCLYMLGGAERVLAGILRCFPEADVYCLFDTLSENDRAQIGYQRSRTSFLQRLPGIDTRRHLFLPLMPLAIEQLDLSGYDLVISSSYAVAKGVLTGPDQLHLSYVHSPMRFAWDMQHQYLREAGIGRGAKSWIARLILHRMRLWDARTALGVDAYAANSHHIAQRIKKTYGRDAEVIYPPVQVPEQPATFEKQDYFLTASRLVPCKNVEAIVEAFRQLPCDRLVVAGDGPERARLEQIAGPNVQFVGFVQDPELRRLMRDAAAFISAAEDNFGIAPIEAQGQGTPVIALGRGGVCETVRTTGLHPTGLFFDYPEPTEIAVAIRKFISNKRIFDPASCHRSALRFSGAEFEKKFKAFVHRHQANFRSSEFRAGDPEIPVSYIPNNFRVVPSERVAVHSQLQDNHLADV
jgi:glycosyltransferase involved in cell wall biosynthesis